MSTILSLAVGKAGSGCPYFCRLVLEGVGPGVYTFVAGCWKAGSGCPRFCHGVLERLGAQGGGEGGVPCFCSRVLEK